MDIRDGNCAGALGLEAEGRCHGFHVHRGEAAERETDLGPFIRFGDLGRERVIASAVVGFALHADLHLAGNAGLEHQRQFHVTIGLAQEIA